MKSLQEEIRRPENDGESGLIIKYIRLWNPKSFKNQCKKRQKIVASTTNIPINNNTYEILNNCEDFPRRGKLNEFKCILRAIVNTVHAILLTETWIRTEDQAVCLQIPNYTHYYNYRADAAGGGVSAYIHNNINIAYQSLNMSEEITIYGSK